MKAILERLSYQPHRGSASREAASARQRLVTLLRSRGHEVRRQPFKGPQSDTWDLVGIFLVLAVAGLVPSGWLALVGVYAFWAYFSRWPLPWAALRNRSDAANLIARAGRGRRTLMLMAHVDTATPLFVHHPNNVRGFRANFLVLSAQALALVPLAFLWLPGARVVGILFLALAAVVVLRERGGEPVNGANDNASGVAVATQLFLDLPEHLMNEWQIMLALTGCAEVGNQGARKLLSSGLIPKDALILNLDSVGQGQLCYVESEGMLLPQRAQGKLLELARKLPNAEPTRFHLEPLDTLLFSRAGYSCLTLTRLEGGVPAHWHWKTDTLEAINLPAVANTYAYARILIERAGVALPAPVDEAEAHYTPRTWKPESDEYEV